MTELVGTADHYAAFVELCRTRIAALGITYETVDELAGFPLRYTAKLLAGQKVMSGYSLMTLARSLALLPAFHHDQAELARLKRHSAWQDRRSKRDPKHWNPKHKLLRDLFVKTGQRGGMIRARRMTRKQRREIAQKAAAARWQKAPANE